MGKIGTFEILILLGAPILFFFVVRVLILWYYKIDERIAQQHETNRLLRKLVGEPEIDSHYLTAARNNSKATVSTQANAQAPIRRN